MQDDSFQTKEIDLVRKYVEAHPGKQDMDTVCPVCKKRGRFYFDKWNVDYLRCDQCRSIFAVCDEKTLDGYMSYEKLNSFRLSDAYQEQMTRSRQDSWREFLEWVEVRAFRFLGRNRGLDIIDIGNRLSGYIDMIKQSDICKSYTLTDSIYPGSIDAPQAEAADIVFCNDVIKTDMYPHERIKAISSWLKKDGLLFIGARAGSGFDIITLKEHNRRVCPYEHVFLPSAEGIVKLLEDNGFEILEIITPGVMDVKYVMDDADKLDGREEFVRFLLSKKDENTLQEFQRFLQKSLMSSYVRVIARKAEGNETI